jgi:hypothetical protein
MTSVTIGLLIALLVVVGLLLSTWYQYRSTAELRFLLRDLQAHQADLQHKTDAPPPGRHVVYREKQPEPEQSTTAWERLLDQ